MYSAKLFNVYTQLLDQLAVGNIIIARSDLTFMVETFFNYVSNSLLLYSLYLQSISGEVARNEPQSYYETPGNMGAPEYLSCQWSLTATGLEHLSG